MFGARLVLVLLIVPMAGYVAKAQVPGFHGTLNNYDVGMNDEEKCRHPQPGTQRACSQWFHVQFRAFDDGTVKAPIRVTNDSLEGYCGRIRIVVRDRANPPGKVLLDVQSPRRCIDGKSPGHEVSGTWDWSFKTDPVVGRNGADLFMEPVEYEGKGIDFGHIISIAIEVVGAVAKVAEAIIP